MSEDAYTLGDSDSSNGTIILQTIVHLFILSEELRFKALFQLGRQMICVTSFINHFLSWFFLNVFDIKINLPTFYSMFGNGP